jgi:hypothetical protein
LWGRNANGRIARSYSWKDDLTLNIFNAPYVYCKKCSFWNKFKTAKQILANHENCEDCIKQNLASISNDDVIQKIEEHLRRLYG